MLLFTTDSIEGKQITQYLGMGTGLGIDKSMPVAYNQAITQLTEEATQAGADAVIGIRVSAFGIQSYFGYNISGTMVKL